MVEHEGGVSYSVLINGLEVNAEFIVKMAVLYRADVIVPFVKAMLRRTSPNARRQSGKYYGRQKKRPVELMVEKTI